MITVVGLLLGSAAGWIVGSVVARLAAQICKLDGDAAKHEGAPIVVFETLLGAITGALSVHYLSVEHALYLAFLVPLAVPLLVVLIAVISTYFQGIDHTISDCIYDSPILLLLAVKDTWMRICQSVANWIKKRRSISRPDNDPIRVVDVTASSSTNTSAKPASAQHTDSKTDKSDAS